jgi:hypothetical protein
MPTIPATQESEVGIFQSNSSLGKVSIRLHLKSNKTGDEDQVVEYLPNKNEAFEFNPEYRQRKTKQNQT